ncbi:MAG: RHS repeat-associated core domain-containing protein [Candidatus Omnitrophota bacterium]
MGRFITVDPSGMTDGPNLYLYAKNNPVNLIDLWGLCVDEPGLIDVSWQIDLAVGGTALGAKAINAGLSAGANAVLYSGPGAKALAAASSGIPIFKTVIGGAMNRFELATGVNLPKFVWDASSAIYAATARGTVQVFLTESNYTSTFYRIEAKVIELLGKAEMVFK